MQEKLLENIEEAIKIARSLSQSKWDKYAHAHEALMVAKLSLTPKSKDRSAECKCECHTGNAMHFVECSCYSGSPILD